jgi:hypothetical protein
MSYPQYLTPAETLAKGKTDAGLPPIAVICGSTRFMQVMVGVDRALTWGVGGESFIVVKPGCDMKNPHPLWADPADAEAGKERLDDLHRAKIRLADRVYVVAPGGYIGDSTRAEIAYAESLGLTVHYVADGNLTPVDGAA